MMKATFSFLVILSCTSLAVGGRIDAPPDTETCASHPETGSESGCGAESPSDASVAGVSLLQTRTALRTRTHGSADLDLEEPSEISLLEESESESDEDFIKRASAAEWSFEAKLPAIIAGSVAAITEATPYFEKKQEGSDDKPDPKAILMGITVLAKHLYKIFHNGFIELVEKETPDFDWDKFEKNWLDMWEKIPRDVHEVDKLLKQFSEEGKTHALIQAIGIMLDKAMTRVNSFLPAKAQKDVEKYFKIVTRTVNSIGKSWAAFEKGDGAKGAEAMYAGIKGNVDALLPAKLQNDKVYQTIMGTVDKQMAKLSETVMKFKKKMTESRVCIKKSKSRKSKRPTVCPDGMILQGKECKQMNRGAALMAMLGLGGKVHQEHLEETEDLEEDEVADEVAVQQKFAAALQERAEEGSKGETTEVEESLTGKGDEDKIFAECDDDSKYPDLFKGKCYAVCPSGYIGAGKICSEECQGAFPVGSGDWCGKSKTAIGQAKMQMVISAINAAASIAITIATAIEQGKDKNAKGAMDFSGTIDSLTNAALAFVFPSCPF